MQRKPSDNFPIIIAVAILAVFFLTENVFGNLFYASLMRWLSERFGVQEAQVITGFSSIVASLVSIILIVIGVTWYIRRELLETKVPEQKERSTEFLPKLSGEIVNFIIGQGEVPGRKVITFSLQVVVRNSGLPSIAEGWKIQVIRNSKIIQADLMRIIPTQLHRENSPPLLISPEDAIYEKTIVPIPTGGRIVGWIIGLIETDHGPLEEFQKVGTEIVIRFIDVTGTPSEARASTTATSQPGPSYVPGGNLRFAEVKG